MKALGLSASLLLISATSLRADDIPFATPAPPQPGNSSAGVVSLSDIMIQTQMRHIKLWYAGQSGNWGLVDYEINRITESLLRAATLYNGIPIELVTGALKPIGVMQKATADKDHKAFVQGYAELTKACNACHEAGGVGFLTMQTPTSLPFTNESFTK